MLDAIKWAASSDWARLIVSAWLASDPVVWWFQELVGDSPTHYVVSLCCSVSSILRWLSVLLVSCRRSLRWAVHLWSCRWSSHSIRFPKGCLVRYKPSSLQQLQSILLRRISDSNMEHGRYAKCKLERQRQVADVGRKVRAELKIIEQRLAKAGLLDVY